MTQKKVDVHAHFIPEVYRQALLDEGITYPEGMPGIPEWSPESHLTYMDEAGIAKSILSISSPGTNLTTSLKANQILTQQTNEIAATLKRHHPIRFGFFASLPFIPPSSDPNESDNVAAIAAALETIEYVFDKLDADGIILLSNTCGLYLGDPRLRPILEELDKREAVVFLHPTISCCSLHSAPHASGHEPGDSPRRVSTSKHQEYLRSSPLADVYPAPLFEYFFDSARNVIDLIMSGTIVRFGRIKWIVSHCGNVLPDLLDRLFLALRIPRPQPSLPPDPTNPEPHHLPGLLARGDYHQSPAIEEINSAFHSQLYFDLAGASVPHQIHSLLQFASPDRLLFGSDVPWTPWVIAKKMVERMEDDLEGALEVEKGKEEAALLEIWSGTAKKLRLA